MTVEGESAEQPQEDGLPKVAEGSPVPYFEMDKPLREGTLEHRMYRWLTSADHDRGTPEEITAGLNADGGPTVTRAQVLLEAKANDRFVTTDLDQEGWLILLAD